MENKIDAKDKHSIELSQDCKDLADLMESQLVDTKDYIENVVILKEQKGLSAVDPTLKFVNKFTKNRSKLSGQTENNTQQSNKSK